MDGLIIVHSCTNWKTSWKHQCTLTGERYQGELSATSQKLLWEVPLRGAWVSWGGSEVKSAEVRGVLLGRWWGEGCWGEVRGVMLKGSGVRWVCIEVRGAWQQGERWPGENGRRAGGSPLRPDNACWKKVLDLAGCSCGVEAGVDGWEGWLFGVVGQSLHWFSVNLWVFFT